MHIAMFWHEIKTSALKKSPAAYSSYYINAHQKCVTKKCWSPKSTLLESIENSYQFNFWLVGCETALLSSDMLVI